MCLILVVRLSAFCFVEHEPIQSFKLVNEGFDLSGVHPTRTAFVIEELVKRGGMREWRDKYDQNSLLSGRGFPRGWPFRVPSTSALRPEAPLGILLVLTALSA